MAAEEIILNLQIESKGAIKSISAAEKELKRLKQAAKESSDPEVVKAAQKEYQKLDSTVKDFNKSLKETKAVAGSIAELRQKASALNKEFINAKIGSEEYNRLQKELSEVNKELRQAEANAGIFGRNVGNYGQAITETFKNIALTIAATFTVDKIADFTKEAFKLGMETEEVKASFDRLNDASILKKLSEATDGALNNLELMKLALRAENLGVPLNDFAVILELANKRSEELGLSVEDVAEKVLNGIAGKSVKAFRDLGITAFDVGENFKGISLEEGNVADVSKIMASVATEELKKIGKGAESTADKVGQISANFENAQIAFGGFLVQLAKTEFVQKRIEALNLIIEDLTEKAQAATLGVSQAQLEQLKGYEENRQKFIKGRLEEAKSGSEVVKVQAAQLVLLQSLNKKLAEQEATQKRIREKVTIGSAEDLAKRKELDLIGETINQLKEQIRIEKNLAKEIDENRIQKITPAKQEQLNIDKEITKEKEKQAALEETPQDIVSAFRPQDESLEDINELNQEMRENDAILAAKQASAQNEYNRSIEETMKLLPVLTDLEAEQLAILGSVGDVLGSLSSLMREDTVAQKVLASAQAVINTYLAVTQALANTSPFVTTAQKIASAIAVGVQGLAAVAKINGVQFAEGGYTGDGGKYEPAGIVHKGEVVWSKKDVAIMGGARIVDSMRPTYKGYADGGIVAPMVSPVSDGLGLTNIVSAIQKLSFRPVVSIEDFRRVQSKVDIIQKGSTL